MNKSFLVVIIAIVLLILLIPNIKANTNLDINLTINIVEPENRLTGLVTYWSNDEFKKSQILIFLISTISLAAIIIIFRKRFDKFI